MGADLKKPSVKWRIGDWVACSATDTIACGLARHKLERRAMEALVVLAERGGEVVKKDELIAAVWGRVAVSDHSVAMVVSQLRRAFSDDARAPRYIETITKRGYRLIAPCEPVNATPFSLALADARSQSATPPPAVVSVVVLVCTGFAIAGLGAVSALLFF